MKAVGEQYAIIDLGSNTFHLLIISIPSAANGFKTLYKSRAYVKLASGGKTYIDATAWQNAMDCLEMFVTEIKKYKVASIKALGTAMLRKAENAQEFLKEVDRRFGIKVDVIQGQEEAQYILQGVKYAVPEDYFNNSIILDIGGGSVECIITKDGQALSIDSYPIGIAILKNKFHHSEPISEAEILKLEAFIDDQLGPLLERLRKNKIKTLIGCSGTFEVLFDTLAHSTYEYAELSIERSLGFIQEITSLDMDGRLRHISVPNERADLIVVALLLIRWFITRGKFDHLLYSPYAMKEGAIADFQILN